MSSSGGGNVPHAPCVGGNGVPENIKQIFVDAYMDEFGLDVPEPARARSGVDKLINVTSTLYHPDGDLYRIYWTPVGSIDAAKLGDFSDNTPRGRYKVAVLAIDYHTTNAAEVFPSAFIAAGDKVNSYFSDFSQRAGLDGLNQDAHELL